MRVTIFSTGGEIPPCFDFYAVTRSYSSLLFLCVLGHDGSESVSELVYRHVSIYMLILS